MQRRNTILPTNPIEPGWYADPEARFYNGKYWIYATRSETDYTRQMNLDAFSSVDLVTWEKHESIIDRAGFPCIWRAVWAPTIIEKNGFYYLMFASNDIRKDGDAGGLEIAVAQSPQGPFRAMLDHPLIETFIHGAQPIDAHLFRDDDGSIYLYYGGWKHCNVARLNDAIDGFLPQEDGQLCREITPEGYVEAPCMLKRHGVYHFMWSEGDWVNGSYRVCTAVCNAPTSRPGEKSVILQADASIADGPGHHGYLQIPGADEWLIVYHRRVLGDLEAGHRVLCIDRLSFDGDTIAPVVMT